MEHLYLIIVGILFVLAITDLTVGVSNDAVNFLIAAIGSKAGSYRVIMIMASLGVFVGAIFSDGMMEVARKGIFHPQMFYFSEIIVLFLAVMITEVVLLDFFNTLGFPTSTTVSLVFGMLGAAVGIAMLKVINTHSGTVVDFINTEKAIGIIGGILLSVVVAFVFGTLIQWIARIIFSFNYEKEYKYFGAIWASIAATAIIFFMFINGFKHSTLKDLPFIDWILHHQFVVIIISFVGFTIIFQALMWLFKTNVLKIVVLLGTFALAMAFAGNDLVNFIGVPLAGFSSYELWHASGVPADQYTMESLAGPVTVNPYFLIIAGFIMIFTIWTSKKAKTVTETSVNLSRQDAGYERFGSTPVSRALVRWGVSFVSFFDKITPKKVSNYIESRFEPKKHLYSAEEAPAFDLIRGSVNLVVSSILIAIATSYKLPLSTTYVTFMVAMASSLSDKAWGRESAVFRVTGVITVITGWFLTALIAFVFAFIIAIIITWGGKFAIAGFVILVIFFFYRSRVIHKKRMANEKMEIEKLKKSGELNTENIYEKATEKILKQISDTKLLLNDVYEAFKNQSRKNLKHFTKSATNLKKKAKELKQNIHNTVQFLDDEHLKSAQYYVQIIDAVREVANASTFITERFFEHIDNNHNIFSENQFIELDALKEKINIHLDNCIKVVGDKDFSKIESIRENKNTILSDIENAKKNQLVLIQNKDTDLLNSNLYLNILAELKNLTLFYNRVVKAHSKFYMSGKKFKITE